MSHYKYILVCVIASICLSAFAQDGENITRVGSGGVSGNYLDVKAYNDEVAYYTNRFGLVVMDVSDPEHPHPARIISTRGNAQGLFLKDSLLFLCDGYEGLRIYDVNDDPWNPREINHTTGPTNARGLEVVDNYAYLWQYRNSVGFIYDISNPSHPEELSRTDFEGGDNMVLHPIGDLCLVTSANVPASLWDISNRRQPELIDEVLGHIRAAEKSMSFVWQDSIAISANNIWNILNLLNVDSIGLVGEPGLSCIDIRDNLLFGTGSPYDNDHRYLEPGITIIEVANYRQPQRISWLWGTRRGGTRAISRFFDLGEGRIFTCDGANGTTIFDVSDVVHPAASGYYDNRGDYINVAVTPEYIYAADKLNWHATGYASFRLHVYSRRPINNPEEVYNLEVSQNDSVFRGGADEVDRPIIKDDRLYCLNYHYLAAFTLEDPVHPAPLFIVNQQQFSSMSDFVVDRSIAFGVGLSVYAIDFSDYRNPRLLSSVRISQAQGGIACDEHYLYVHSFGEGMHIYNRDDERRINQVGLLQLGMTDIASDILLYADRAYIILPGRTIIVNISDRGNPAAVGDLRPPGGMQWRGSISDGVLFTSCSERGVYAYSLEDPDNPRQIGYYDTPGRAAQTAVQDGYLYVADTDEIGVYDVGRLTGVWDITLADSAHDFGSLAIDSTSTWTLELRNNTDHSLPIDSLKIDGACFGLMDTSAFSVDAGEIGSVALSFTPDSSLTYEGCLRLFSLERELNVSLTGEGAPLRVESFSSHPVVLELYPAYPNPFNSTTLIHFALPRPTNLRLSVIDLSGKEVALLTEGRTDAGSHEIVWDASTFPSGLYLLRLDSPEFHSSRKLVLVK